MGKAGKKRSLTVRFPTWAHVTIRQPGAAQPLPNPRGSPRGSALPQCTGWGAGGPPPAAARWLPAPPQNCLPRGAEDRAWLAHRCSRLASDGRADVETDGLSCMCRFGVLKLGEGSRRYKKLEKSQYISVKKKTPIYPQDIGCLETPVKGSATNRDPLHFSSPLFR